MIIFQCQCGKAYKVEDRFSGRRTRCGECGCDIVVPTADGTESFVPPTQQDVTSSFAEPADEIGPSPTESYVPTPDRPTPTAANDATIEFTPTAQDDSSQNNPDASPQNDHETSKPDSTAGAKNSRSGGGKLRLPQNRANSCSRRDGAGQHCTRRASQTRGRAERAFRERDRSQGRRAAPTVRAGRFTR